MTNSTNGKRMPVTQCECTEDGWCSRHECFKSRMQFLQCQRSERVFDAWERGQLKPHRRPKGKFNPDILKIPCVHRSLDSIDQIECQLCGYRKKMVAVFACEIHSECTVLPSGGRQTGEELVCCLKCSSYEASTLTPSVEIYVQLTKIRQVQNAQYSRLQQ